MSKEKRLVAIHYDPYGKVTRTTIATGTSADFATPTGFQIIDVIEQPHKDGEDQNNTEEENGTYPVMLPGEFRDLEGKLKTLADATFTNTKQCDAFKSMIAEILWSNFSKNIDGTIAMYNISKQGMRIGQIPVREL